MTIIIAGTFERCCLLGTVLIALHVFSASVMKSSNEIINIVHNLEGWKAVDGRY